MSGTRSAPAHSPLIGAEIVLPPGDAGCACRSRPVSSTPCWSTRAAPCSARVLLLGGEPLGEQIVMWWNFVGRSHEETVAFRSRWETGRSAPSGAFGGPFPRAWTTTLPAPALPGARLRPRM